MPKGSEQLSQARRNEVIRACSELYETTNFKDISLKLVAEKTSFTRTSIYNYFQSKEEIFLAILEGEYRAWNMDLRELRDGNESLDAESFSSLFSETLEKRGRLLKIMSMNHYDLEDNVRLERLVEFKKAYGDSLRMMSSCLKKFFPRMDDEDVEGVVYAFFPFMFGIYPYTHVTPKQREAMEKADSDYVFMSIYELSRSCLLRLLGEKE